MKRIDVCGLGSALVDILLRVSDAEFAEFGVERGSEELVDSVAQKRMLSRLSKYEPVLASGGSVANSMVGLVQLGGTAGYQTCLGDDRYGLFFKAEFDALQIEMGVPLIMGGQTGTCLTLVTPDGERTMRVDLGVASHLSPEHIEEKMIQESKWLFVEGYAFGNPQGPAAIARAVELAKRHDTKVCLTISERWVAEAFREQLMQTIEACSLIFANEHEAAALTGLTEPEAAFRKLLTMVPNAVVTMGPKGAWVAYGSTHVHVPAFVVEPKDLTGAGDMLAAGILYGITQNISPEIAGRGACYLAMQVIQRLGARLQSGVREYWTEATGLK